MTLKKWHVVTDRDRGGVTKVVLDVAVAYSLQVALQLEKTRKLRQPRVGTLRRQ